MNVKMLLFSVVCVSGLVFPSGLFAQAPKVDFPAASPACTLKQRVGLTDFEIVYSRPGVKGRTIFGGIVPYGQVWRTGANQATRITFSTPVKFNGTEMPAGTYALFTIPGENEWTVILNTNSAQWGAYQYDEKADVARFKVTPVMLSDTTLETFTIEFNHIRDESAVLNLVWDKTVVPIHLAVDVTGKVVAQIEAAMASPDKKDAGLYFQAATFYYNHGLDLKQALAWVNTGLEGRPRIAFELFHLKAQILAKQGDKEGAIAAAKQSSELAVKAEGPGSSFVKMNDDIISSLK
jgi:hypothetical protein